MVELESGRLRVGVFVGQQAAALGAQRVLSMPPGSDVSAPTWEIVTMGPIGDKARHAKLSSVRSTESCRLARQSDDIRVPRGFRLDGARHVGFPRTEGAWIVRRYVSWS